MIASSTVLLPNRDHDCRYIMLLQELSRGTALAVMGRWSWACTSLTNMMSSVHLASCHHSLPSRMCCSHVLLLQAAIMGHSMGGHGALVLGLRNPDKYASISAFAPISNPVNVPWGKKAFGGYLGSDESQWKQYDASELLKQYSGPRRHVLVDVGTSDDFLKEQLKPESLTQAARGKDNVEVDLRMQVCNCGWSTFEVLCTAASPSAHVGHAREMPYL